MAVIGTPITSPALTGPTMGDLILDVLPRLVNAPKSISIYQAANSILSLVYKKLLDRGSDLLASGNLSMVIAAQGYYATLPTDFVSMAEKPRVQETGTDYTGTLQPKTLIEDDGYGEPWWESYGIYSEYYSPPTNLPSQYKIIGNTFYVRPQVIDEVTILGKYNQKPINFTLTTDIIPWNGLFYEVFKEGVVRIIMKEISIPDADADFMLFMRREMDVVLTSRGKILPHKRTTRGSFL
jgi:hypothetical protein